MKTEDIPSLIEYWMLCSSEYLLSLGADIDKLPSAQGFNRMLSKQLTLPYSRKESYALIWEIDGIPSGHTNVNRIEYGQRAYMHLHLWHQDQRTKGAGSTLVKKSLPYFFNNLTLNELLVEPYALNEAPNKALKKVGFTFIKKYNTIPGPINFEQQVNQWKMTRSEWYKQKSDPK